MKDPNDPNLLPCPFCGSSEIWFINAPRKANIFTLTCIKKYIILYVEV